MGPHMGTTAAQRREIADLESLAAIVDAELERYGLLALQPAVQRRPDLLDEITQGVERLITARQIIFRRRAALRAEAGGLNNHQEP